MSSLTPSDLHWTKSFQGIVLSAFFAGYILTQTLGGAAAGGWAWWWWGIAGSGRHFMLCVVQAASAQVFPSTSGINLHAYVTDTYGNLV